MLQGSQLIQTQGGQIVLQAAPQAQTNQPQTIQVQGPNGQLQQVHIFLYFSFDTLIDYSRVKIFAVYFICLRYCLL